MKPTRNIVKPSGMWKVNDSKWKEHIEKLEKQEEEFNKKEDKSIDTIILNKNQRSKINRIITKNK